MQYLEWNKMWDCDALFLVHKTIGPLLNRLQLEHFFFFQLQFFSSHLSNITVNQHYSSHQSSLVATFCGEMGDAQNINHTEYHSQLTSSCQNLPLQIQPLCCCMQDCPRLTISCNWSDLSKHTCRVVQDWQFRITGLTLANIHVKTHASKTKHERDTVFHAQRVE